MVSSPGVESTSLSPAAPTTPADVFFRCRGDRQVGPGALRPSRHTQAAPTEEGAAPVSEEQKPNYKPETVALHAGYTPRPHHRVTGGPHLPDHQLPLPRRGPRGPALRAEGVREHLHADHEPHQRRPRAAHRGAGGRRGGAGGGVGTGGGDAGPAHHPQVGRRAGQHLQPVRRDLQPVQGHLPPARHPDAASSRPPTSLRSAAAIGPKTKALYAETLGNPRLDVIHLEELGKIAKEAGIPFIVDNTATTPGAAPSHRARGEHRRPLGHQVHRRARAGDRRPHRRRRQLPLGQRKVPRVHRAEPRLPRPEALGDVREHLLHPQGPGRAAP